MDKYTEEQKLLFTAHLKRLLKVVPKQSIYKVININSRTFENRLITQKWKDHEIWYFQQTFNF
jgi:hypothetical protein